jgi:hypothetical protein
MTNIYYSQTSGSTLSNVIIVPGDTFVLPSSIFNSVSNTYLKFNDAILEITASAYNTTESFSSTVGTLRVYVRSGSIIYASFPLETVNIFYNTEFINTGVPSTPTENSILNLYFSFNNMDLKSQESSSYFITSSNYYLGISGSDNTGSHYLVVDSDKSYTIIVTGSSYNNNYSASLLIYDTTNNFSRNISIGTLIASAYTINTGASASFYPTSSNSYYISMNITGA